MSYVYEMSPEDSSNSEKDFDQVIEEDVDNSDKENVDTNQPIRTRSTKIQLRILDDEMDGRQNFISLVLEPDYLQTLKLAATMLMMMVGTF